LIRAISISNLGVISQTELQLTNGLNVISGETGAGKTMLLTALQLMLGARADSSKVREGQKQMRVSGIWEELPHAVKHQLAELGADEEDDLVITRTVNSEGKSRAIVGGAYLPIGSLGEIANNLVVIHGQSDQIRLRSSVTQREALDSFGGTPVEQAKLSYQQSYQSWLEAKARMERLQQSTQDRDKRIFEITEFLNEMEQLAPEPDELDAIGERLNRLENVEVLRNALADSHRLLSSNGDSPDAEQLLGQIRRNLESVSNKDPQINSLAERASELLVLTSELASEMSSQLSGLDAEPGELDKLNDRKSKLISMERRFGGTLSELSDRSQAWANELLI
jgi:DNA repair protein RecN (Recombination protein N)